MTKDEIESKARWIPYSVSKGYLPENDPKLEALKGLSIDEIREYVLDELEEARKEIVNTYLKNTKLKEALDDAREIIFWCDKYYLVKANWFTIVESDPVLLNKAINVLKNSDENI